MEHVYTCVFKGNHGNAELRTNQDLNCDRYVCVNMKFLMVKNQ